MGRRGGNMQRYGRHKRIILLTSFTRKCIEVFPGCNLLCGPQNAYVDDKGRYWRGQTQGDQTGISKVS